MFDVAKPNCPCVKGGLLNRPCTRSLVYGNNCSLDEEEIGMEEYKKPGHLQTWGFKQGSVEGMEGSLPQKSMAEIEVKASENVMEACARTPSVKKCVLTSSLLACIWRVMTSPLINHDCWSDESLCIDNNLWYALGKLRAEKIAWRIAKQRGLKLITICPGLITGPQFCPRNSTATIAYFKGAQEMYADGLLATVDVVRLAEAHVCVFEAMNKTASGRYICFDRVIQGEIAAEKLAQETGISRDAWGDFTPRYE